MELPQALSFAKIRGSYAEIGNGVPSAATTTNYTYNAGKQLLPTYFASPNLKPETQKSTEVGAEVRFLDDRIALDVTLYQIRNTDQFFNLNASVTSGTKQIGVNIAEIENKGIEMALTVDVIKNSNFNWSSSLNFTKNVNTVNGIPLGDGKYALTAPGVNSYGMYLTNGGSYGEIYGQKFLRHDGKIVVDGDGKPLIQPGGLSPIGNPQPKTVVGWNNTISFKNFSVNLLIDGRFGGKVMSVTNAMLDQMGATQETADARDAGGVNIPAVVTLDGGATFEGDYTDNDGLLPASTFYQTVGGRAGITEYYMSDATNVRLRELSVGYKFPGTIGIVKDLKLSLIGRNLFFFTNKAPFDPELSMSTGIGVQGVDAFSMPSTRSIGLSLKASF